MFDCNYGLNFCDIACGNMLSNARELGTGQSKCDNQVKVFYRELNCVCSSCGTAQQFFSMVTPNPAPASNPWDWILPINDSCPENRLAEKEC